MRESLVLWCAGIVGAASAAASAGIGWLAAPRCDEPPVQGDTLEASSVELPPDARFVIGRRQAFPVSFTVTNRGEAAVKLWTPGSSEASRCARLVLTDAKSVSIELTPPPIPRLGGVPSVVTIDAGGSISISLDLAALLADREIEPGEYRIHAVYENTLDAAGPHRGVWTGRATGAARAITVAQGN